MVPIALVTPTANEARVSEATPAWKRQERGGIRNNLVRQESRGKGT